MKHPAISRHSMLCAAGLLLPALLLSASNNSAPVKMIDLGALGGYAGYSQAFAVNNRGQVVGSSGGHAVLWEKGAIVDLGTLPGFSSTIALGINNRGQVVGNSDYRHPFLPHHAFLWTDGVMIDLFPGQTHSMATGINDSGKIVGLSGSRAFLWDNGVMTDLSTLPGGCCSLPRSINNSGQVAGEATDSRGNTHAVLWQKGAIIDLGVVAGGTFSVASSINERGQVAGSANGHAAVWEHGSMTDLLVPNSVANAINNRGLVVGSVSGTAATGENYQKAVLWDDGKMIDIFNLPGSLASHAIPRSSAQAINDAGDVVGFFRTPTGVVHAFLLERY